MKHKLRLGYCTDNLELKEKHIHTSKTTRLNTIKTHGKSYALELARSNLEGILEVLKWNQLHGIKFYRMSSMICPHITNPALIKDKNDYKALAYSMKSLVNIMAQIGEYARKHGMRLTFHPDPFISLGTSSAGVLLRNTRELWFHCTVLDMMGLDLNSTICIHLGGFYGNKADTMKLWIKRFNALPIKIKRRIAIENDEFSYSVQDMFWVSAHVDPFPLEFEGTSWKPSRKYKICVIFDIFHYICYNQTIVLRELADQWSLEKIIPIWLQTWGSRRPKGHISEQKPGGPRGAHSDMVMKIPAVMRNAPKKYGMNVDLMIESKNKEKATMYLMKKYKL